MKPVSFEYCRPNTIAEAIALLEEFGADATVLAGGMSLGAMLNMRLVRPTAVIDIKRIAGLDAVTLPGEANGEVRTGATLRQAVALENSALMSAVPLLARALPNVGHYQTRNRGTLGGSVAHADPVRRSRSPWSRWAVRSNCNRSAACGACRPATSSSIS